jgi:putative transposase
MLPQRKRIRLAPAIYHDPAQVCSITTATHGRRPLFRDSSFTLACINALHVLAQAGTEVHAYRFMPDHVHLVLSPSTARGITEFVGQFKGKTTRLAWSHGYRGRIWQPRFYDHFVRKEEGLLATVLYVLNNPVREGLVGSWKEYPFGGSCTMHL